ncbi:MAG: hypothetical protein A2991_03140 [Candidatus Terrybacteria bacterium RIFCSPLOWO2_01_FULL_58_14]|uniref:Small ribosomal subunit protein bS6 n=2 Tax=Candidatus Terryibacteriota TaxID=1817920 RepID=A0A1G2PVN9_9BACT|nr:MAG: hypothetical protein A2682_02825 [Candidatus Terrybacteria bacterium RIFCSPHIGHO2_01_FULL_58_15]OHA52390.1 MAG: hypothetical protein A2991_03140 [Candidatus Terrybacteria bacterium RIFCSPLOWO2_01_FULL_58_14]
MDELSVREPRRRDYELAAVLSASATDEERDTFIAKLQRLIADVEGELIELSPPKPYALAYPIRKERQGVFRTLIFRGPTELPERIAETVRHDTTLLRHFVIERPKPRRTPPSRRKTPVISATEEQRMEEQIEAALKESAS